MYSLALPPFDIVVRGNTLAITASADLTDKQRIREQADGVAQDVARSLSYELAGTFEIEYRNCDLLALAGGEGVSVGDTVPPSDGFEVEPRDAAGRVISTAHQRELERQETQQHLTDLSKRAAIDPNLRDMLVHWSRYVADPDGRLHPLYDVLQVVERVYGDRRKAASQLGISYGELRKLGQISNDPTVLNGRHPGNSLGPHRTASEPEVNTCERVVREIIKKHASKIAI